MKAKKIALILIPLNIILFYLIYNSINSEVVFNKEAEIRIAENVQKLKDLRQLQIKYKQNKGQFANNFKSLIDFLEYDSIPIVRATGETPDSLINGVQISDELALELGLISRDTAYVPAKENIFDETYMESRKNNFILDLTNLINVPYSNSTYNINAGQIEKGNVTVQVFEISANYRTVFKGLDAENKSYNLDELLKVGSMTEASLNGNWRSE
ncbi:MAG: hypothetical protein CMD14_07305 [Flavobacteriales bacterium]|nr:hypothetical protein [Flavobacteriales bacterium]|tara:strand:- start:236 stop:874 length:639 start_codon:yes stop_codon:yes gene_type:complete